MPGAETPKKGTRLDAPVHRGTKVALAFALMLAPAIIGAAVYLAAPKGEVQRDHPLPEGNLTVVAVGRVAAGDDARPASGTVTVYANGTGHIARFEDYEARAGANVWFRQVASADEESTEIIESQPRIRVPGPGQATYRGTFNLPLPDDFDPAAPFDLIAWDTTWNIAYARITLAPASAT